ncbi:hypothetical protein KCP69_03790 [Salmonella enterica subsp. enterica]|nr:hypothetical protein KCP69_03790 [Salmonella enterica subsp. enterica]
MPGFARNCTEGVGVCVGRDGAKPAYDCRNFLLLANQTDEWARVAQRGDIERCSQLFPGW